MLKAGRFPGNSFSAITAAVLIAGAAVFFKLKLYKKLKRYSLLFSEQKNFRLSKSGFAGFRKQRMRPADVS